MEALKILLNLGIDVNAVATRSGETAMHGAAGRGADLIVQFLADHGANVNAQDKQGRTPIEVASGAGSRSWRCSLAARFDSCFARQTGR